jgi:ParB family chromosome partitioning protein
MTNIRKQIAGAAKIGVRAKATKDHPASLNVYEDGTYFKGIEIDLIKPDPDQPRKVFEPEALQDLANSIKIKGVIQPVIIRRDEANNTFILVAGERRWRASKIAGKKEIPAILKTEENTFAISLIENLQRENLNPIEEAQAYERMIKEYSYSQEMLADVIGKARATITNTLILNKLPEVVKEECSRANISKRTLIEIAREETEEKMIALFNRVKDFKLTSDDVRNITREKKERVFKGQGEITSNRVVSLTSYLEKLNLDSLETEDRVKVLSELQKLMETIEGLLK